MTVIGCNMNNEIATTENKDIINQQREIEEETEKDITKESEQSSEPIETEQNIVDVELLDINAGKKEPTHKDSSASETKYEESEEKANDIERKADLADNEISDTEQDNKQEIIEKTVTISIEGLNDTVKILEPTIVNFEYNDTVFDITKRITGEKKIHLSSKGSGSRAYIEGIDNLYEFDRGPTSGWLYSVNGDYYSKGCGTYQVSEGDEIKWVYTLDLGKDLGVLN